MSSIANIRKKHAREPAKPVQLDLPLEPTLVDRFGHEHSAAVLQLWSPKLIEFMALHPLDQSKA